MLGGTNRKKRPILPHPNNAILITNSSEMISLQSRFEGSLLGGACGDALGYPVEHKSHKAIISKYGENGIQAMELGDIGEALITDDTQMTIYTAQGLIHAFDHNFSSSGMVSEVHKSYLRWIGSLLHNLPELTELYHDLYSKDELLHNDLLENGENPGLDRKMCRGGSTFTALLSGNRYSTLNPAPEGVRCGTTMRSAPIALVCYQKPELAFSVGCECAALTHGDPTAYLSAGVMCMLISHLLSGMGMREAIDHSLQYLEKQPNSTKLLAVLQKGIKLAQTPSVQPIDDIKQIGKGWRADENLSIVLYCCIRFDKNVKDALLACVNHDGDSDSVAAVCGNVMGAYVGREGLPDEFVQHIQFKDLLVHQANELLRCSEIVGKS